MYELEKNTQIWSGGWILVIFFQSRKIHGVSPQLSQLRSPPSSQTSNMRNAADPSSPRRIIRRRYTFNVAFTATESVPAA